LAFKGFKNTQGVSQITDHLGKYIMNIVISLVQWISHLTSG